MRYSFVYSYRGKDTFTGKIRIVELNGNKTENVMIFNFKKASRETIKELKELTFAMLRYLNDNIPLGKKNVLLLFKYRVCGSEIS
jgi:hypothetical protein